MTTAIVVNNLNLTPGHRLIVKGYIPKNCARFAVNLGENESNYILHLNPRFKFGTDVRNIIINCKENNVWGKEQREKFFPFQEETETTICFEYPPQGDKLIIKLTSGEEFTFSFRKPVSSIQFLSLKDILFKSIVIE